MAQYVSELRTAVTAALGVVWERHETLQVMQRDLVSLTQRVRDEYEAVERLQLLDETPDDVMLTTGRYWDNYFGDDKERHAKAEEIKDLEEKIEAQDRSVGTAAPIGDSSG
jgi:hypothetical protein